MLIMILRVLIITLITLFLGCKAEPEIPETNVLEKTITVKDSKPHYKAKLPTKSILIGDQKLLVEVADDNAERARGLMFRSYLPDTVGMLFIFDEIGPHPFWMKNTFIPLSIAFVDRDSIITDIKWMKPKDESSHYPSKPVLFAIETNRGWFVKRNITPGTKVKL